ncbi:histidine--tRNA ligase family protein [Candidatus Pacearchaeota archaeon]|nr:histidine--tRNA ligase family protein [Candidatus Pacearchaeota archaeon]
MTQTTSEPVKGFSDFTGQEAEKRAKIRRIIEDNFKLYGFEPAETPIVEFEDFAKGENEFDEAVSDIFKLKDKGERKLALRYELTFPLKRISQNKKLPYKRYQIGEVFRDEPTSSSRFRQFTQCDIDAISSSVKEEAEVLACISKILKELKIEAEIQVNSRKLLNSVIKSLEIDNSEYVLRELDKVEKQGEDLIKLEMAKFISKDKIVKLFQILRKPLSSFKKFEGYKELKQLIEICENYNFKPIFKPSLARGLSYYNGSIYEARISKGKESIAGGGSYLINGIQSTGISFGLERLSQLAKIKEEGKKVLIISINQDKKACELAEKLRKNKIIVSISDKISRGLEYANSYNYSQVIFIGSDEVKKKKFKLRDMKTGKEEFLSEKEMIEKLV